MNRATSRTRDHGEPGIATGFALVAPNGDVLAHTLRLTAQEAVRALFDIADPEQAGHWRQRQAEGWGARKIFAHIWVREDGT
jgi:hypothetical protein